METKSLVFRGYPPLHCCCDSTLRRLPNGDLAVFFMTGGAFEPEPSNHVVLCRSLDDGLTWGPQEIVHQSEGCKRDLTKPPHIFDPEWRERCVPEIATTMSEVTVHDGVVSVYLQIHDGHFGHWRTAVIRSTDSGLSWGQPECFDPLPKRSMIRNLYQASWGEYLLPYQFQPTHGDTEDSFLDDKNKLSQMNGVLMAPTPHGPWRQGGQLQGPPGWAEVNVVELSDNSLVMLCRSDDGVLLRSDSRDRGMTWSPYRRTSIPHPGSKFRLFKLRDGRVVLLHNASADHKHPNAAHKLRCSVGRNPLAMWISSDDMETWSVQRVVCDFPGALAYPDGEIDQHEKYLEFAFDYNRHDVIFMRVEIPTASSAG